MTKAQLFAIAFITGELTNPQQRTFLGVEVSWIEFYYDGEFIMQGQDCYGDRASLSFRHDNSFEGDVE